MSFTGDGFEEMQRQALDLIVSENEELSREQIVRMLEEDGPYAVHHGDPTTLAIAAASEPAEVARALLTEARGSGTILAEYLLYLEADTDSDDNLLPAARLGGPSC